MITLLRRMRKSLIESGSARRYLLYAIGEIGLVVIGILIALQINNWNQERQEKQELDTYLENIKNNLRSDLVSLAEIKSFRDSSMLNSKKYLLLAKKEDITPEEFTRAYKSRYGVFIDRYFRPRTSGFEALKSSGYIRKLNGSLLEEQLNEYYYILELINDVETSLAYNTETMENFTFDKNVRQRMIQIAEAIDSGETLSLSTREEIHKLINHPNMTGAHLRNSVGASLPEYYRQAEELAKSIIVEIDDTIDKY